MTDFNEFKKKVCNFYRQNKDLFCVVSYTPSWGYFIVEAELKNGDGVKVVFSYKIEINSLNRKSVQRKVEKLTQELSDDLKGIEHE